MGNFWRELRPLRRGIISASIFVEATERTYQSNKDYPRCKHERRKDSRNKRWWGLLLRAESMFDSRLWMVVDFLWVWGNRL